MSAIPGTNVAAKIAPFTTEDTYPTHESQYGKGGWHEVSALTDIPDDRITEGMIANVAGDQTYVRQDGAWVPYSPSNLAAMTAAVRKAAFLE